MTDTARWSFPDTAIILDPNYDLKVFTLTPNWKNGVLERIEFLTDVMSSEIAAEQRRSSRRSPRRSFEASFLRADGHRTYLDSFFAGMGKAPFLVPLWHEQYKLQGQPTDEGYIYFPSGTLTKREFRFEDLVLIQDGVDRFEILTVGDISYDDDMIFLHAPIDTGTWSPNARITPLRRVRNLDPSAISNPANRVGQSTIRFSLMDADSHWSGDNPYVWTFKPDRATSIDNTYDRTDFVIDFKGGVMEVEDPGQRAQIGTSLALTLFGRDKIHEYRTFLYATRGRARRFWMPTFTQDLQPIAPPSSNYVDCTPNGFAVFNQIPQDARGVIVVTFKDPERAQFYRYVNSVDSIREDDPPSQIIASRFYVSGDFPDGLTLEEIATISFLAPTRFDQDTFEILYPTDDMKVAKTAVVTKSTDGDDMPELDYEGGSGGGGSTMDFPMPESYYSNINFPTGSTLA